MIPRANIMTFPDMGLVINEEIRVKFAEAVLDLREKLRPQLLMRPGNRKQ
jgi:hypothetical protein